jgi:hypothetical protein
MMRCAILSDKTSIRGKTSGTISYMVILLHRPFQNSFKIFLHPTGTAAAKKMLSSPTNKEYCTKCIAGNCHLFIIVMDAGGTVLG